MGARKCATIQLRNFQVESFIQIVVRQKEPRLFAISLVDSLVGVTLNKHPFLSFIEGTSLSASTVTICAFLISQTPTHTQAE